MAHFKCGFSEINYTFCFLHEYLSTLSSPNPPFVFFPTQPQEYDLGFDTHICGYSLFFQFKRPANFGSSKCFNFKQCFTFYFEKDYSTSPVSFRQNDLLCSLVSQGFCAVYVAPLFNTLASFQKLVYSKKVVEQSRFLWPLSVATSGFCLGSSAQNHSCLKCNKVVSHKYLYDDQDQVVCSEPKSMPHLSTSEFLSFDKIQGQKLASLKTVFETINGCRNEEKEADAEAALTTLARNDITFLFFPAEPVNFE